MRRVDDELAVVYPSVMAFSFWQELKRRGMQMGEVPDEEFASMGPNVLALAPRRCLMLEGNPRTQRLLEEAGCSVVKEISLKAEGGPTCLTRPLLRAE